MELERFRVPPDAAIVGTDQVSADDMVNMLIRRYTQPIVDSHGGSSACVIGVIDSDLNSRGQGLNYLFARRGEREFPVGAIISTARFNPSFFGDPPDAELERSRLRKMTSRMIGSLYYKLPPSDDPESPVTKDITCLDDVDKLRQSF